MSLAVHILAAATIHTGIQRTKKFAKYTINEVKENMPLLDKNAAAYFANNKLDKSNNKLNKLHKKFTKSKVWE